MPEPGAEPAALLEGAACAVHGTPATFVCYRCGNFGCEGCVGVAFEGQRLCASCVARGGEQAMPWERLRDLGLFTAFWKTSSRVTFSPTECFRASPEGGSLFSHLAYGVLAWTLAPAIGLFVYCAVLGVVFGFAPLGEAGPQGVGGTAGMLGLLCASVGFGLIMLPVYAIVATILDAGVTHLVLYLTG